MTKTITKRKEKNTNRKETRKQQILPTFASLEVALPAGRIDRVNFVARHDFLYQLKLSWDSDFKRNGHMTTLLRAGIFFIFINSNSPKILI